MLKIMGVLVMLTLVFGAVFGSAALLQVEGGTIQAGADIDLECDDDGVQVDGWGLETSNGLVYYVRIVDIDNGCSSCDMFVNITDINHNKLAGWFKVHIPNDGAPGPGPTKDWDSDSGEVGVKIPFDPPILAVDIYDIEVFIEGSCNG